MVTYKRARRPSVAVALAVALVGGLVVQVAAIPAAFAVPGDLSTIAGTGSPGYSGDGGPATSAQLNGPTGVALDGAGNIYIGDIAEHVVRKIDHSTGNISTFAGNGTDGDTGDGGQASAAEFDQPFGVTFDSAGNLFIADQGSPSRVRKVDLSTGIITAFAGNGQVGSSGDGGPATQAGLNPQYLAFTSAGLYIADDANNNVRLVNSSGIISTVASGINEPVGMGSDPAGNAYVTAFRGNQVDKIDPSGNVTVVAGTGSFGYTGDGGSATAAQLGGPYDVKFFGGSLYISEWYNHTVRKVDAGGTISTIAGTGSPGYSGDGGPATSGQFYNPTALAIDSNGDVLVADYGNHVVRKVEDIPDLVAVRLHGPAAAVEGTGFSYQLSVVNLGTISDATGVTVADTLPASVTYVGATPSQGSCSQASATVTCSLGALAEGATATVTINVKAPAAAGMGTDQATVTADQTDPNTTDNSASLTTTFVNGQGVIYALAGNGTAGYAGDGGPSTAALVSNPQGIRTDGAGNIYFADSGNNVVRKIDPLGTITTFAGNGTSGFSGDGGPAPAAQLSGPTALAIDAAGNVFIADNGNRRIRRVDPSGVITTVAGDGNDSPLGDGRPATSADLGAIQGVAVDSSGNLYLSQPDWGRIRKVDGSTGIISLFKAGLHIPDLGCPYLPAGLTVDQSTNSLLVAFGAGAVGKIDLATQAMTIIAGTPACGGGGSPSGDGGPATQAGLGGPSDVNLDAAGDVYIADARNENAVRRIDTNGIITTVAGGPSTGFSGDGGPATMAKLNTPAGVAPTGHGSFVVTDANNNEVRIVTGTADLVSLAKTAPLTVAPGGPISYQLQVSNDGSAGDATGVVVTDPLPAGVSYLGASSSQGSCGQSGATVTCTLGTVSARSSATVTVNVTAPSKSASVVNTASVHAGLADPVTTDNSASATTFVAAADVGVSIAASPNTGVDVGNPLTYTVTVANHGPQTALGVKVKDVLPAGMTIVSTSVGQGSCAYTGATVTCSLGGLASGSSTPVTINVNPTTAGVSIDTATVKSAQVDQYPFDNTASLNLFVSGKGCGETITKSVTLTADIGPCGGSGVTIGANKIKVNLGGHRIFGRGDGVHYNVTDDLVGIALPNRSGVTLTGGTVSGFDTGIFVNSGGANTITKMTSENNIGQDAFGPVFPDLGDGILIEHSSFNKITANTVNHNGSYDGIGVFGLDTNANLIQGNTVENTLTGSDHSDGEGIILNNFLAVGEPRQGLSIVNNNVIGNKVTGNAASGISNVSNDGALIENNTVTGNGLNAFPSNGIGDQVGKYATRDVKDTISGNHVSGNGDDGIEILAPLFDDTITGNVVSSNNVNNDGSFNLEDTNGNCTADSWTNNTVTNGAVSPACLVPGGAASPAAAAKLSANPDAPRGSPPPLPQANRRLPPPAA